MKSGFIFKQVIILALALLVPVFARAQSAYSPGLHAGADVLKSLWAMGLVAEPVVKYNTGSVIGFSLTYGYVNLKRDSVYSNISYRCKGSYLKPGVEFVLPGNYVSFGLSYLFSGYTETGISVLQGPYFGNKEVGYRREMKTRGVEANINLYIPVSERLSVQITARLNNIKNHMESGNNKEVPVFYAPGAGRVREESGPGSAQIVGISAGLLYRITPKVAVKAPGT